MLPVGTYKLSLYLENWLAVTSLLARKNSLIDVPGNSSLRALKFLQHCAAVFMKLAGFPPISGREIPCKSGKNRGLHSQAVRSPASLPCAASGHAAEPEQF